MRGFIDRKETATALHRLSADGDLLRTMSRSARRFALDYSWHAVVAQWDRLLRASVPKPHLQSPTKITTEGDEPDALRRPATTLRSSGHSSATLPIPRLGIPVRLAN